MKTNIRKFQIVPYNRMDEKSKNYLNKINEQIEKIGLILMKHENKDFCTAAINRIDFIKIQYNDYEFFIAPSFPFKELIIDYGYINAVDQHQNCFGKGDDQHILTALQTPLNKFSPIENLHEETMAYLFQIVDGEVSDKVLRIDLYRDIKNSKFIGGIFHFLKHFTIEGFDTISNSKKGTPLENFRYVLFYIISNFYLPEKQQKDTERKNNYISYSYFDERKSLKGVYYKEENIPVYFINTMYVEDSK